jgi:tRNA pseudouridine38/39 synthase
MVTEFENLEREGLVELLKKFKSKNGQLSDQISQMKVIVAKLDQNDENLDNIISEPKKKKLRKERTKEFLKRKIAVRFSYDGSEFNGLQRSPVPTSKITVEDCLFHALIKSHIVDNVAISDYIAGGRTDKIRDKLFK